MSDIVCVQFREGGKPQNCLASNLDLKVDTLCVVETEHGPAVARVVRTHRPQSERRLPGPLRRVLRLVTPRDLEQLKHNDRLEREAYRLCAQKVLEKKLSMKLVDVTYTLEARKAIFYFTAENRVDFRELVKELARALRVKIEMRQIGVRDEARRLGGVGACGRALCCCTFLRDFVSVSIRMAKDQNVSLNPTKVSGICGRLMCCLSYEYDPTKPRRKKGEAQPGCEGGPGGAACAECPGAAGTSAAPSAGPQAGEPPAPAGHPRQRPGAAGHGHDPRQSHSPRPGSRSFLGGGDRRGGRPGPSR